MGEIGAEFSSKEEENRLQFYSACNVNNLTFVNQTKFVVNEAAAASG
jgi:hypothetical protein